MAEVKKYEITEDNLNLFCHHYNEKGYDVLSHELFSPEKILIEEITHILEYQCECGYSTIFLETHKPNRLKKCFACQKDITKFLSMTYLEENNEQGKKKRNS